VDEVEIFVDSGLVMVGPVVRIDLGGFWKLRRLRVSGVAALAACAV